jgi:pimeloyl-ACP methyl ester carboxylesterase
MKDAIERAYVRTRWGQLHYWRAGATGPTLVLLHQTANSSRMWLPLAPYLGDRLRLYAFDTPGFGMSDPPPAQPRFDDYCDVFFEAIDRLGLTEIALVGFHTGAGFAAGMAARASDRVSRLILMGTPVFDPGDDNMRRTQSARLGWAPDPDGAYLARMWRISTYPDLWVRHRELTDRLLAGPRAWWASAAVSETDVRAFLPAVRCPTLLLCGSKDFMVDKQQAVADLLPDARLVILPGETLIVDQKPAEVADQLLRFLAPSVT